MTLNVPTTFGWVLLECVIIAMQVLIEGVFAMKLRKRLFSKAFFEQHFPQLKGNIPKEGYPDMGSGKFAEKLSLEDWMEFNNYQRAHYNYLEGVASILVLLVTSGLFFPRFTALFGVIYIVGRVLYGVGYRRKGAAGRLIGAGLIDVCLLALLASSAYGAFNFAGGLKGFKQLIQM